MFRTSKVASSASISDRIYMRPNRYEPVGEAQHCAWVFEDDEEFLHRGIQSIRCQAPVYWQFGVRNRPKYYCEKHGDQIILHTRSPRAARKTFSQVSEWRGR